MKMRKNLVIVANIFLQDLLFLKQFKHPCSWKYLCKDYDYFTHELNQFFILNMLDMNNVFVNFIVNHDHLF